MIRTWLRGVFSGGLVVALAAGCSDGDCVPEVCNGIDDDCDGATDEDLVRDCSNGCGAGSERCAGGRWAVCSAPQPAAETCNGADDDCDGLTDEDGEPHYRDADGDRYGDPRISERTCSPPVGYVDAGGDCNDADAAVHPDATERCNGVDDDCDAETDEGCDCVDGQARACGDWGEEGACELGEERCASGAWGACTGGIRPAAETCNGVDDDCDGSTDEGLTGDGHEPNDTCVDANVLGTVPEGSSREPLRELAGGGTVYRPAGGDDTDWYRIVTEEESAACVPWTSECCYRFAIEFTPPPGIPRGDVRLCYYYDGSCSSLGAERCLNDTHWNATAGVYEATVCWSGSCGSEDGKTFWLRVDGARAGVSSCAPYRIRYNFYRTSADC